MVRKYTYRDVGYQVVVDGEDIIYATRSSTLDGQPMLAFCIKSSTIDEATKAGCDAIDAFLT
tara:strand:+ start:254 stop:439 length:186 start_codon:yes stop_codon:yes gene_type:complete